MPRKYRHSNKGHEEQWLVGRRLQFCSRLRTFDENDIDELIRICPDCGEFFLLNCADETRLRKEYADWSSPIEELERADGRRRISHKTRLVFTDGACSNNGRLRAFAGIGIAWGAHQSDQLFHKVDSSIDRDGPRTSQRAELLAAWKGVETWGSRGLQEPNCDRWSYTPNRQCVFVSDSEYVTKGMTEWLPKWKENGYRNARGQRPSNLDLFIQLDEEVTSQEEKSGVDIGFWHVPREYNNIADSLAKRGAQLAREDQYDTDSDDDYYR